MLETMVCWHQGSRAIPCGEGGFVVRLERSAFTVIPVSFGLAAGGVATAQEPEFADDAISAPEAGENTGASEPDFSVAATVTLASEYRFRGIDLTDGDPAHLVWRAP